MVATLVFVALGVAASKVMPRAMHAFGCFRRGQFRFELAPGNIPTPVLPAPLPVARVVMLPPPCVRVPIGRPMKVVTVSEWVVHAPARIIFCTHSNREDLGGSEAP